MNAPNYRDYNRLLRNQVLLAMAIEKMAARISGNACEASQICRQLVIEVDEFERITDPAGERQP